jgi:hypothetical protein
MPIPNLIKYNITQYNLSASQNFGLSDSSNLKLKTPYCVVVEQMCIHWQMNLCRHARSNRLWVPQDEMSVTVLVAVLCIMFNPEMDAQRTYIQMGDIFRKIWLQNIGVIYSKVIHY